MGQGMMEARHCHVCASGPFRALMSINQISCFPHFTSFDARRVARKERRVPVLDDQSDTALTKSAWLCDGAQCFRPPACLWLLW